VAADDEVGVFGGALTLDVAVFRCHPLLPLRARLLAVALEATLQSELARRLDPDRVREIRTESLA
jgi:hypothetical protein